MRWTRCLTVVEWYYPTRPDIVQAYSEDIEESLGEELLHFSELLKTDIAAHIIIEKNPRISKINI